ncbi:hypothetical protein [Cryobacterium zhongshanensis]|uniref:Uncharacterized protein n=1 Tax=Cryobacterium zhongshanensis TaxID=2928153 RepID=A0AA41QYS0_9MICO|nr:hypothetical protein [Cryobacterium zhongshanensis]MCI4659594.1 hypothetical protein [Cryobacterium zhongshanensis]
MAFGRRKSKESGAEAPAEVVAAQATKPSQQKKRKPAELLSSVVNESAVGAAIDLMKQNASFALPNGTAWVGLLLSADEIGGLSQKQKGDATKGSIIELIAADKIQVVATKAMLDEEFLGIIPSVETLSRMNEYSLLTEAHYYWAVFRSENNGQNLVADAVQGSTASYAEALSVARGETTVSALLPEVWAWGGGTTEPVLTAHAPVEPELVFAGAMAYSEGSPAATSAPAVNSDPMSDAFNFGDEGVDYASMAENDADPEPQLEFDTARYEAEFNDSSSALDEDDDEDDLAPSWQGIDTNEAPAQSASADEATAGYYQYVTDNKDRVVDEQEVRDTIARRFLSNDLDLVVDLAEFDRTFATEAAAISIGIADDPSDWLGSQVAQLSRQANAELARLHQGNTDELREMFVETMALHVENTMAVVSTEAQGSQYFGLMAGAKKDFEAQRAAAPQEVSSQRREITARFETAAVSRSAQAAAHARAVYEDKNRPKLERDLAEVGLDLDRRHEEQYAHDRQTVLEMRRKDANVRMDIGTNRIFELLRERQAAQREDERELLEHWNGQLTRFIDENRKNDMSRALTLAEQLARDNQVAALKVEHAARLKEMRTEHADREERLNSQLIRNREDALAQLNARSTEWDSSLALEKERTRSTSALTSQLSQQLVALGEKYDEQYRGKISTLEADKQSYVEELNRASEVQKRANSTMVLLVVILAIAALAVGVIAGWAWGAAGTHGTAPAGFAVLGSFLTGPTGWMGT